MIGDAPVSENTEKDYENCLRHLRAFFGGFPVDEIDADLNLAYKEMLLKDSRRLREALDAGADLRDRWNRPLRPLGLRSISHILQVHCAILESAVEGPDDPQTGRANRPRGGGTRLRTTGREGLPPLPNTTPHTLRRTYISVALIANNFDLKYVMDQVGHADSTMTMEVYAQLQKRFKRSHGVSFDRLVREASEQVKALPRTVEGADGDAKPAGAWQPVGPTGAQG